MSIGPTDIDIAQIKISNSIRLNRVGMSRIECPALIAVGSSPPTRTPARIDAFVSLDEPQKGIHMSRLFLAVEKHLESAPLTPQLLQGITRDFLQSHKGLSESAFVRVTFDLMIKRPALISENSGWRSYPVSMWASSDGADRTGVDLVVRYSSTCPCSASLSRQLIQKKFDHDFAGKQNLNPEDIREWLGTEDAIAGTPHGQRSEGRIRTELKSPESDLRFLERIITALESALQTPVQAAVKRADEQEFARLNASNLMFAEDACRRMHGGLSTLDIFNGTLIEACHIESLHPHDAVAKVATGTLAKVFQFE